MQEKIYFSKIRDVKSPTRGTKESAGIDFYIPNDWPVNEWKTFTLLPHEDILIPSGIKVNMPKGHALIAYNKSGVVTKKKLLVGACVVDSDYQNEIHLHLVNTGQLPQMLSAGDKIIQFILTPINFAEIEEVKEPELYLEITERGLGGFGSTGND